VSQEYIEIKGARGSVPRSGRLPTSHRSCGSAVDADSAVEVANNSGISVIGALQETSIVETPEPPTSASYPALTFNLTWADGGPDKALTYFSGNNSFTVELQMLFQF
jgi:hypothetical protein